MKVEKPIQPPGWAQRFLNWYCKPELLEDLEGDLREYFERNVKSKGPFRARVIYVLDVFKFLRSYTIRKPSFFNTLIHYIMLISYVKTSTRNIYRNKFFSAINIIGLAISMSVGLLMISMLHDAYSYDKFHEKHDRIYRVISRYEYNGRKDQDFHATTSLRAAKLIDETFTGPEGVVILHRDFRGDVTVQDKTIPLDGLMANESFFEVFSFKLLQGNPMSALKMPFSIVLTEKSALKLFNDTNVLGKTLVLNHDRQYTVTGIMEDVPKFSHLQFDMLASLSTREVTEKDNKDEMSWDNMWSVYTYLLMPKEANLDVLRESLDRMSAKEDATVKLTRIELDVERMDGIIAGENRSNQLGPTIGSTVIYIFGLLTLIVLISACFNYTNLSVARSFRRSKEVGIRKTVGALKSHVATQFIVESIVISIMALFLAFIIFLLVRPHFIGIEYSLQVLLTLDLTPSLIILFIVFAIIVGLVAGLVPALFFSKLDAIQVLKNLSSKNIIRGLTMRKALIVFQYTISIMFITGTAIMYRQYKHFLAYDLGFSTANIINIRLQDGKADLLKKELEELPEVQGISKSAMVMSVGNYYAVQMKYHKNPQDSGSVYFNSIDEHFIPLHNIELVAGRNFVNVADSAAEGEVIVNKHVLKKYNISPSDPEKALGEIVQLNKNQVQIIGVVDDFEYGRANNRANKEVVLRYSKSPGYLNVKILSDDWIETKAKIEAICKKIDPVHSPDVKFYSHQIEESFQGLKAAIKLGGFIAFLVIVISSVGLLGMVVYTTETRMKEVSIRKVLGASEAGILILLSRGFVFLLLVSASIALPVTFVFYDQVMLPQIANHAPMGVSEFVIGILAILSIALAMIGSQTFKVARTNPAEILKAE
ncbi:MAG TPA: ABC transporter permease [Chryseosolibacter sp.]